ncbi:Hypothetical_protein [Hexamita inflata]|uniref:Hypothetical_protein n=1 Tax=Hexamita inflata TaxID=28002 RepID=A0AA86N6F0_9EUKA|nr:Hypothetical protein HINF_LOCUS1266 [Hexamita inflata]
MQTTLAFFKKQAEGLQLRANLVDFGLYLALDLVFHFSYRPLFLKYSSNINKFLNFCYFYVYNDLNSIIYCRLLSFLVYIWLKTRQNQYYLINQISKHFSYRPQIQFSYKPFYQQKSKGSVTEHFWGLQVNRGSGLWSEVMQYIKIIIKQYLFVAWQISHGAAQNVKNVRTGRTHDLARSRKQFSQYYKYIFVQIQKMCDICVPLQHNEYIYQSIMSLY